MMNAMADNLLTKQKQLFIARIFILTRNRTFKSEEYKVVSLTVDLCEISCRQALHRHDKDVSLVQKAPYSQIALCLVSSPTNGTGVPLPSCFLPWDALVNQVALINETDICANTVSGIETQLC